MLCYNLLTTVLSLIRIFRIYDQNEQCFHAQTANYHNLKSSPHWIKETEVTHQVEVTEAVPRAE